MHDPEILVCDIPLPRGGGLLIWHHDPQHGGSDDSCGWSYPRLTEKQRTQLRGVAFWEAREKVFMCVSGKEWIGSQVQLEHLYRTLLLTVARALCLRITFEEAAKEASMRVGIGGCETVGRYFCFQAGWHTNRKEETVKDREDVFYGVLASVARELLHRRRRWWQHPRWHIWHWRLQLRLPWKVQR